MGGQGIRFGRKTGATLKRSCGGRRNVSCHHSIHKTEKNVENVYKHGTISNEFAEQFDDGDLGSHHAVDNGVQYSLNKRKRWTIPGILKEDFQKNSMHVENSFQVRLIERHVLDESTSLKRADCIAVHSSKGKRSRKPRKTFSHVNDLIGDASPSDKTRKKRGKATVVEATIEDPMPMMPEIQYVVSYSRPADSFPNFNPSKDCKSKIKTKRNRLKNCDVMDELLDIDEDYREEDDDIQTEQCNLHNSTLLAPNLGQFITASTHTKPRQRLKKGLQKKNQDERKTCPNKATNQSWIYFGKDAKVIIQKKHRVQLQKKVKIQKSVKKRFNDDDDDGCQDMPSICVNICKQSCTADRLLQQFGSDYIDGESLPRKFSVNISEFVNGLLKGAGQFNLVRKMEFWGHEICVVFITAASDDIINMRLSLYGIKKSNCCLYLDAFEASVGNSRIYTVLDVVDSIKRLFTIHPPIMYDFDSLCLNLKPQIPLRNLSLVLNIKVEVMTPRLALKLKAAHEDRTVKDSQLVVPMTTKSGSCGICDDDLLPSRTPSLALRSCQHWFCNDCWRLHIESRIQQGDHTILCPGHDCKSPVDNLSLMSLLPADQFFRHKVHAQNRYVESNPAWHWCPRPQCGRVARVEGYDVGNAFLCCDCGLQSCLGCKAEVHWPATCQQFEEYQNTMKEKGVKEKTLITHVQVKRCPVCHQPMEKNGGCPMMECRCGALFCWRCLSKYDKCSCYRTKLFKKFEVVELNPIPECLTNMSLLEKAQYYHKTIKGIKQRRQLQRTANDFIMKMFHKECKPSVRRVGMLMPTQTAASPCDQAKLHHLLTLTQELLQFFFEAKKILQYSFVLASHNTKHGLSRDVRGQIARLEHIVQRLEEILSGNCRHHYTLDSIEKILQSLLNSGNICLRLMVHKTSNSQ